MNTENTIKQKELSGVLIIDKHSGITSHGIIGKIRRLYNIKRVGHTGTLDPMATGVLPVLVGRAAKASDYIMAEDKTYITEIFLGITTDTEDITGKILSQSETIPSAERVLQVCSAFVGEINQIPPMYSALKVNGKKLVDLARGGIEIERSSRKIKIYSIDCEAVDVCTYKMTVKCSKGTYIRTLCADIGTQLGCGAVMKSLRRIQTGMFGISQSVTIDSLEKMTFDERVELLRQNPVEAIFGNMPFVILPDFYARLAKNGAEIYLAKIQKNFEIGANLRIYDKDGFFAIGEVREYPGGPAIFATKLFVL